MPYKSKFVNTGSSFHIHIHNYTQSRARVQSQIPQTRIYKPIRVSHDSLMDESVRIIYTYVRIKYIHCNNLSKQLMATGRFQGLCSSMPNRTLTDHFNTPKS